MPTPNSPMHEILQRLAFHIGENPDSCNLLATATNPSQTALFTDHLNNLLHPNEHIPELFSTFLSWCGNNRISPILQTAIEQHRAAASKRNRLHRDLVKSLWLSADDQCLATFISSIKVVQVIQTSSHIHIVITDFTR